MKRFSILAFLSLLIAIAACKKDVLIPDSSKLTNTNIEFKVPENWPSPYYSFVNNQLTNAGFELGRTLFYDTRLSRDNTISCGSCHQAFAAFTHSGHDVSHGIDGKLGNRNSPPLFNLNWHTSLMWDGGVNHLEVQPLAPIDNPVEMDETLPNVLAKLRAAPKYASLFQAAYGSSEITSEKTFKAMAQFMGAMVSANAKYDKYMRKESGVTMTQSELAGMAVYEAKCASCHKAPLFTDFSFRNVGLKPNLSNDSGRAHITLNPDDMYKFKVPSLRNLSYTSPYFHDGRASTLDKVFDQMETQIYDYPTLDPAFKNGIKLSAQERIDMKAFLKTLDDESFIKDSRFFEPTP
ncbi:MAG: c-type cytochrome [Chitinophagaceae bacterium]|nr:c-type cytochrome [Chitinophagaceae bacterium]